MLTKCPKCNLQISNKAISCPHCGYPLVKAPNGHHITKRSRLPNNGFGSIRVS